MTKKVVMRKNYDLKGSQLAPLIQMNFLTLIPTQYNHLQVDLKMVKRRTKHLKSLHAEKGTCGSPTSNIKFVTIYGTVYA